MEKELFRVSVGQFSVICTKDNLPFYLIQIIKSGGVPQYQRLTAEVK